MLDPATLSFFRRQGTWLWIWTALACTQPPPPVDNRTTSTPDSATNGPSANGKAASETTVPGGAVRTPTSPTGNGTATGTNTSVLLGSPPLAPAKKVSVPTLLRVLLTEDGQPAPTTYADLQPLVRKHCLNCHGSGLPPAAPPLGSLDMTAWVYKSRIADPQKLVEEIILRLSSLSAPMPPPPATALTGEEKALWQKWLDGGLLIKAPPAPDWPFLQATKIQWRWRPEGPAESLPMNSGTNGLPWQETVQPWVQGGEFKSFLTELPDDKTYEATVTFVGEDGKAVASQMFAGQKTDLPLDITLKIPIAAVKSHTIDRSAPTPGRNGVVTATNINEDGFSATWAPANDDLAPQELLTYAVYLGDETPWTTVNDIQTKTRLLKDFAPQIVAVKLDQLLPSKTYKLYVLVRDASGNTKPYETLTITTKADSTPPVLTNRVLTATELSDTEVRISWVPATDKFSPSSQLTYEIWTASQPVLTDITTVFSRGISAGPPTANASSLKLTGLAPFETYSITVLVRDELNNATLYDQLTVQTLAGSNALDLPTYATQCVERLGELRPFNCLDGQIAPITINGIPIPPNLSASQAASYSFGNTASTQVRCDRPALLNMDVQGQCIPYSRYGRLPSFRKDGSEHKDVDTVFSCRHYKARVGPIRFQGAFIDASVVPLFDDIAIIQHNRVTGETCWFQQLKPDADGRRVPPPHETALPAGAPAYAASAANFWLTPQETFNVGCNNCHDSDPWIHSPYIDQLRLPNGEPLVPSGMKLTASPRRYSMLGARLFNGWEKSKAISTTTATPPGGAGGKSCTSCHLIGSLETCANWLPQSTGVKPAPNLSAKGASFPLSHWMPPSEPGLETLEKWNASGYKAATDSLIECCKKPTPAGCTVSPLMTVPPPYLKPSF